LFIRKEKLKEKKDLASLILMQVVRVANKRLDLRGIKLIWVAGVVLAGIKEALGLLRFWKDKIGARRAGIIEYK